MNQLAVTMLEDLDDVHRVQAAPKHDEAGRASDQVEINASRARSVVGKAVGICRAPKPEAWTRSKQKTRCLASTGADAENVRNKLGMQQRLPAVVTIYAATTCCVDKYMDGSMPRLQVEVPRRRGWLYNSSIVQLSVLRSESR